MISQINEETGFSLVEDSELRVQAKQLCRNGEFRESLKLYDNFMKNKKIELTDDELECYMVCLRERLRYKESIELSRKLLKIKENPEDELLNLCICYGKQGEYKKAIRYYEEILKMDKEFENQLGYYAYLLFQNNRLEEAKEVYKIALKNEPDNSWYVSHYALLLEKMGDNLEAIKYLRKAMRLEPQNTWLIKTFVFLYGKVEGKEKAYKYYERMINNYKRNYNLYINYAEYAIVNHNVEYAKTILKKIEVEKMPNVLQIIYHIYGCFIALYGENEEEFEVNKWAFLEKRKEYNAYIHRDFTLLNKFAEEQFTEKSQEQYQQILENLKEGGNKDENC